jgi:phosphatidylglycerophosphatase A
MNLAAKIIATFFGLGYFPVAPGTLASLAAVLLYKLALGSLPGLLYVGILLVLFFVSVPAASIQARLIGHPDPPIVVADEVCGQLATLFLVPATWACLSVGFILFRAFDIFKPFPIRRLEALPGGWGIVVDDMGAAVYSAAVLRIFILAGGAKLI